MNLFNEFLINFYHGAIGDYHWQFLAIVYQLLQRHKIQMSGLLIFIKLSLLNNLTTDEEA